MEPDDDDFGVLYTDNLCTSSAAPIPPPVFSLSQNTLNTTIEDEEDDQHHHSLYKNPSFPSQPNHELQDQPPKSSSLSPHQTFAAEPAEENQSWGFKIPEMEAGIGVFDEEYDPATPGLWTGGGVLIPALFDAYNGGGVEEMNGGGAEDNLGSDESEDDLKIILDDTDLPVRAGEAEDDDEDGEVADGDHPHPGSETEWGEEAARGEEAAQGEEASQRVVEAERKEAEEVAQGVVMMAGAPGARIGYDKQAYHPHNQAYHPHLPQFKVLSLGWPCSCSVVPLLWKATLGQSDSWSGIKWTNSIDLCKSMSCLLLFCMCQLLISASEEAEGLSLDGIWHALLLPLVTHSLSHLSTNFDSLLLSFVFRSLFIFFIGTMF